MTRSRGEMQPPIQLVTRVMELISRVTIFAIILTGAAVGKRRDRPDSLELVVRGMLGVPITGSAALFLFGTLLHLFSMTSIGILLATVARTMPQFVLLLILVVLPLQLLSGGVTPRESMPVFVQSLMLVAPTTHYVSLAQAILYRGAGLDVVWPRLAALAAIGAAVFLAALARFRGAIARG